MSVAHRHLLAFALLAGCAGADVRSEPSPSRSLATGPGASSAASATSSARASSAPPAPPASPSTANAAHSEAPPHAEDRSLLLLRDALEGVLGGGVDRAWMIDSRLFVLGRRTRPADQYAAVLPYPAVAREAAIGGRVVTFVEVWTPRDGQLARVLARPITVRPMVCEFDEGCELVTLAADVAVTGQIVIGPGTCPASVSRVRAEHETTPYTAFDRAVIPAVCGSAGAYSWNGTAFVPRAAMAPLTAATVVRTGDEALALLLDGMFPTSIQSQVVTSWVSSRGDERFVVFRLTHPAPAHAFFGHDAASRAWESGRALDVTEVWLARAGSFVRVLQIPTGLGSLAEPLRVVTLTAEPQGDDLVICKDDRGDLGAPRTNRDALTPFEAELRRKDDAAVARIRKGCGTYHFDGRSFVRTRVSPGASF